MPDSIIRMHTDWIELSNQGSKATLIDSRMIRLIIRFVRRRGIRDSLVDRPAKEETEDGQAAAASLAHHHSPKVPAPPAAALAPGPRSALLEPCVAAQKRCPVFLPASKSKSIDQSPVITTTIDVYRWIDFFPNLAIYNQWISPRSIGRMGAPSAAGARSEASRVI